MSMMNVKRPSFIARLISLNGNFTAGRNNGGNNASGIRREASESSSSTTATDAFTTSMTALFAGV